MGDEFSDWEGLQYSFTTEDSISNGKDDDDNAKTEYRSLELKTISNARIDSSVEQFYLEESSFAGYVSYKSWVRSSADDPCVINILRVTPPDETTLDDGTVWRIEAGRTLPGAIWLNDGSKEIFYVDL